MNDNNENGAAENCSSKRKVTEELADTSKNIEEPSLLKRRRVSATSESSTSTTSTSTLSDSESCKNIDNIAEKDNCDKKNADGENVECGDVSVISSTDSSDDCIMIDEDCAGGKTTGNENPAKGNSGNDNTAGDSTSNDNTAENNSGNDDAAGDVTGNDNAAGDNAGNGNAGGENTGNDKAAGDKTGNDNSAKDNTGNDNSARDNTGNDNSAKDDTGNDNSAKDDTGNDNSARDNTGNNNAVGGNVFLDMDASSHADITIKDSSDDENFDESCAASAAFEFDDFDAPMSSGQHLQVNGPFHAEMTSTNRTPPRPIVLIDDADDIPPSSHADDQRCIGELLTKLTIMFEPRILFDLDD